MSGFLVKFGGSLFVASVVYFLVMRFTTFSFNVALMAFLAVGVFLLVKVKVK